MTASVLLGCYTTNNTVTAKQLNSKQVKVKVKHRPKGQHDADQRPGQLPQTHSQKCDALGLIWNLTKDANTTCILTHTIVPIPPYSANPLKFSLPLLAPNTTIM